MPGSRRREYPGEHLGKSLNDIREALKSATCRQSVRFRRRRRSLNKPGDSWISRRDSLMNWYAAKLVFESEIDGNSKGRQSMRREHLSKLRRPPRMRRAPKPLRLGRPRSTRTTMKTGRVSFGVFETWSEIQEFLRERANSGYGGFFASFSVIPRAGQRKPLDWGAHIGTDPRTRNFARSVMTSFARSAERMRATTASGSQRTDSA